VEGGDAGLEGSLDNAIDFIVQTQHALDTGQNRSVLPAHRAP
jgi:hypothetical protein